MMDLKNESERESHNALIDRRDIFPYSLSNTGVWEEKGDGGKMIDDSKVLYEMYSLGLGFLNLCKDEDFINAKSSYIFQLYHLGFILLGMLIDCVPSVLSNFLTHWSEMLGCHLVR